jgi:hypothetical protein
MGSTLLEDLCGLDDQVDTFFFGITIFDRGVISGCFVTDSFFAISSSICFVSFTLLCRFNVSLLGAGSNHLTLTIDSPPGLLPPGRTLLGLAYFFSILDFAIHSVLALIIAGFFCFENVFIAFSFIKLEESHFFHKNNARFAGVHQANATQSVNQN